MGQAGDGGFANTVPVLRDPYWGDPPMTKRDDEVARDLMGRNPTDEGVDYQEPLVDRPERQSRPRRVFEPIEYDETQSAVRPRVADPEQFTEDRINTLSTMPLEHVSGRQRIGRFLQRFGEAQLSQPLARSGMELAGSAARSAGYGVNQLYGDTAAREMRQEEIGQNQQHLLNFEQARQRREAREQAALKQADLIAGIGLKEANTQKALRGPDRAPHYETRADGTYEISAEHPDGRKVSGVPGKPSESRPVFRERRNSDGSTTLMRLNPGTNKFEEAGVTSAGEPRVSMRLPNGQVVQAPVSAAVVAAAQGGKVVADANNQTTWRQYEIRKAQIDKDNAASERRFAEAKDGVESLRSAVMKAQEAANEARNPAKPGDKAYLNSQYDDAMKRVKALAANLKPYADLVADDPETGWPTLLKGRPEPQTYPEPPAVQMPQGPEAVAPQGAYVGHVFKQSDLPEIQKRLKAKTLEEARRLVEAQGGTFQ
jgi:hypothetical protein